MGTKTEHLTTIESRIRDLEENISRRQEQLLERAETFRHDLQNEFSPEEIIRRYPLQSTAASAAAGFIIARAVKAVAGPRKTPQAPETIPAGERPRSELSSAMSSLAVEVLHSGKELAFSYLKAYLDQKIRAKKDREQ
ncbi:MULTISPECIES: hypothetical protein [Prosthecochloris]|uniref:DUF3618 domain-containing protein n=1 Tax=Prosthecochloris vibrioformis TaxID=1098 RepID=A0A5C4S0J4_PROVB|nr:MULTISPECIES: hypothetical protein [Prosthecochloris]ANT64238.1 hypothetical protein Ptc2401_00439 [Prosthecochloris sp. CIB 2401]TNJ36662.1 hypothetical protein FGF68_06255 [Prosthecochloris vibrioformis]